MLSRWLCERTASVVSGKSSGRWAGGARGVLANEWPFLFDGMHNGEIFRSKKSSLFSCKLRQFLTRFSPLRESGSIKQDAWDGYWNNAIAEDSLYKSLFP